jgi:hypothetical protein
LFEIFLFKKKSVNRHYHCALVIMSLVVQIVILQNHCLHNPPISNGLPMRDDLTLCDLFDFD